MGEFFKSDVSTRKRFAPALIELLGDPRRLVRHTRADDLGIRRVPPIPEELRQLRAHRPAIAHDPHIATVVEIVPFPIASFVLLAVR